MIVPLVAQRRVLSHCEPLPARTLPLEDALGFVLAENVTARYPLPGFDNSAMDGYALRARDTAKATVDRPVGLRIVGTVFAGGVLPQSLRAGEACGIMTGAPVPRGADTVIPQERAVVHGGQLVVSGPVDRHRHVRRRGEEVRSGATVLKAGAVICPGTIACLATVGRATVRVVARPSVSVITTGDEAVAPGRKLAPGQIYDSNSFMVSAMVRQLGIEPVRCRHVKDHRGALTRSIEAALRQSDVLILVGGVSVGDRDYVRSVLEAQRVRQVFWRVKQKPGKPIYFGARGKRLVFGLPGNPASAYACFYVYVYPALRRLMGFRSPRLPARTLPLAKGVTSDAARWLLLKAKTSSGPPEGVSQLPRQGSHMITSLAETNSLIVVPSGAGPLPAGSDVTTWLLPHGEEGQK